MSHLQAEVATSAIQDRDEHEYSNILGLKYIFVFGFITF